MQAGTDSNRQGPRLSCAPCPEVPTDDSGEPLIVRAWTVDRV